MKNYNRKKHFIRIYGREVVINDWVVHNLRFIEFRYKESDAQAGEAILPYVREYAESRGVRFDDPFSFRLMPIDPQLVARQYGFRIETMHQEHSAAELHTLVPIDYEEEARRERQAMRRHAQMTSSISSGMAVSQSALYNTNIDSSLYGVPAYNPFTQAVSLTSQHGVMPISTGGTEQASASSGTESTGIFGRAFNWLTNRG